MMDSDKEGKEIINVDLGDSNSNDSNLENSTLQPENGLANANSKKNTKKFSKAIKEVLMNSSTKFMSDFDPELSNRERRKLTRKFHSEGKRSSSGLDENGVWSGPEKDVCDCLIEGCPGCHFPCPRCRSCKCGSDCRINRKWTYEGIENEGEIKQT